MNITINYKIIFNLITHKNEYIVVINIKVKINSNWKVKIYHFIIKTVEFEQNLLTTLLFNNENIVGNEVIMKKFIVFRKIFLNIKIYYYHLNSNIQQETIQKTMEFWRRNYTQSTQAFGLF